MEICLGKAAGDADFRLTRFQRGEHARQQRGIVLVVGIHYRHVRRSGGAEAFDRSARQPPAADALDHPHARVDKRERARLVGGAVLAQFYERHIKFTGFDADECEANVLEVHPQDDSLFVITDKTPFYAEMGGQSGDTGTVAAVSNRQALQPKAASGNRCGFFRAVKKQDLKRQDPRITQPSLAFHPTNL